MSSTNKNSRNRPSGMDKVSIVGDHLYDYALKEAKCDSELDAFGKAAINRFYYAAFLTTRSMLIIVRPRKNTKELTHKYAYEGRWAKEVKEEAQGSMEKQEKHGIPTQGDGILEILNTYIGDLRVLLKNASKKRVNADYYKEPIDYISREGQETLRLGELDLSEAKEWPREAKKHCDSIIQIRKEVGLS